MARLKVGILTLKNDEVLFFFPANDEGKLKQRDQNMKELMTLGEDTRRIGARVEPERHGEDDI